VKNRDAMRTVRGIDFDDLTENDFKAISDWLREQPVAIHKLTPLPYQIEANIKWYLSNEPDSLRLHLLLRCEVAFDKDFECVADDLRVFITEGADPLLQFGE
jgi:hypothetical protein